MLHALLAALMLIQILGAQDVDDISRIEMGHNGGKSHFALVINSKAMYIKRHVYMAEDYVNLEITNQAVWNKIIGAIRRGEIKSTEDTDHSRITVTVYYADPSKFTSCHLKWDQKRGACDILDVYKDLLGFASYE